MTDYALQLLEDRLASGSEISLPPRNRVVYIVEENIAITADGGRGEFGQNSAWFGTGSCALEAGAQGARLWRWELVKTFAAEDSIAPGHSGNSGLKAYHELDLDSHIRYLMRCDRVDFPLGGIAYTHIHAGPGIRCLLQGELCVQVNVGESLIQPGESWFESGPDPVLAIASAMHLTSFVRVMILPRSLKGKSSIQYIRPEDQDKPKPQQYTRFVDEFIEI